MNKAIAPLVGFIVLAGLFYLVLDRMNKGEYNPRDVPTQFIGKQAPAFDLPDLYDMNKRVRSADMQGKVWLLNVWGTWCAECWKEHDYLVHLKRRGVPIIGINWRDDAQEALGFLRDKGDPFVGVGFDPQSDAVIDWGVYGAPETFLIDAQGIVREKHTGQMHPGAWEKTFAKYFDGVNAG